MENYFTNPDQFSDMSHDEDSVSGSTRMLSDEDILQMSPAMFDYDIDIDMDDVVESATDESCGADISWKSTETPPTRRRQRQAANTRERRRMKAINDAFEGLRARVPVARDDRKLSKVDTLRLAIVYIRKLSGMINVSCDTASNVTSGCWNREVQNHKVVIRSYHRSGEYNILGSTSLSSHINLINIVVTKIM